MCKISSTFLKMSLNVFVYLYDKRKANKPYEATQI